MACSLRYNPMKSKFLYWTISIILSVGITIFVQLLFRHSHLSNLDYVGKIEFLFSAIVLPIYLASLYFALNTDSELLVILFLISY